MSLTRAQALAARRATLTPTSGTEARREAHRALRAVRGAEAAYYSRGAISAVVWPQREFASVAAWAAFLTPLYPPWAVKIGVSLYGAETVGRELYGTESAVLLEPDMPPHISSRDRTDRRLIDVRYYAAAGFVGPDGLWKYDPEEPLTDDDEPAIVGKARAVVSATRAAREAKKARLARMKLST